MELNLYNTKTRKIETFSPIERGKVGMYACGMTVYDYAHIGHGRKYTMDDVLRRTLEYIGYEVKHVQNVTDVGHMSSDEDYGEDKLEKGAEKSGKDVWETARFFQDDFYESMQKLNIERPQIIAPATLHIKEQIKHIGEILQNGFGYDTPEAVYFDVSKYEDYSNFSGQKLADKKSGARSDVDTGQYKKNPADFVLWFKRVGKYKNHIMHWESPWGDGFPGWHIECSAMSAFYLGDLFDIHTGGIDHIPVHHTNEIAQSHAATGTDLANYWFHTDFLTVDNQKMSKSIGNTYHVDDIISKGYDPLALRYLYLGANYRSKLNFTWESLEGAASALKKLRSDYLSLPQDNGEVLEYYIEQFENSLSDDLNTPKALSVLWQLLKDDTVSPSDKRETLLKMDKVFGFGLANLKQISIPESVFKLADQREEFRKNKDWQKSDELRNEIEEMGFTVKDGPDGYEIEKK